jgi:AhpD family alkylhydroperoxidase
VKLNEAHTEEARVKGTTTELQEVCERWTET